MRLTIEEIDHTLTVLAYAERLQAICPSQLDQHHEIIQKLKDSKRSLKGAETARVNGTACNWRTGELKPQSTGNHKHVSS